MNWKLPVMSMAVLLLLLLPLPAKSRFALYFNSGKMRMRTVIVYNETATPLSIGMNGGMDWADEGGKASSLVPGDLTSFRKDFSTGDCILIESEDDGVFLALSSDRDSVYVYAREDEDAGEDGVQPVREE